MGVLNVTPDSFSDGGRYADREAAVAHGVAMRAGGADIVDVGGESTRPGADRIDAQTEIGRVLPVVRELTAAGVPVSIDTSRAAVAVEALAAGVAPDQIIVDPGLGFAKTAEHNWLLSAHLDRIMALGYPVLFAASRKSYLGRLLADRQGNPRPVHEREAATLATTVLAIEAGVWGVRVHDVRASVDAIKVWEATWRARSR